MNNILQMIFQQKLKQIPKGMTSQLEQQLKRVSPQAFQSYQQARKDNVDPNEYLNQITSGFNKEQQQQWNSMINGINAH